MHTVMSNTRNANLYLIVALAIVMIVLLTFAILPSIAAPQPIYIPVTGSDGAYAQYLEGEKSIYASSPELSAALSTYRLGEKAIYTSPDLTIALSAWQSGEKSMMRSTTVESALSAYRQSEKAAK